MKLRLIAVTFFLNSFSYSQEVNCEIPEVIQETVALFKKQFPLIPADEDTGFNFQILIINKSDLETFDDAEGIEFRNNILFDDLSVSFVVSMACIHHAEVVIPQCILDLDSSKVLLSDFDFLLEQPKMSKRKIKKISKYYKSYSNAYITWLVNVDGGKVKVGYLFGNYFQYRKMQDSSNDF
ncbi:MAG: hypothetical protein RLN88_08920 [Ekhidna sp.]|uniref:hypothetical protein n=1 Tax=Ekhidna sp. TaxID=2608089 RepID=UPI0032ECF4FE